MITPDMESSFSFSSQVSAIFFQSGNDIFSDHFVNGFMIMGLHICLISGAMFNISSTSVDITPPVFGSRRDEIVPPNIIIATFGNFGSMVDGRWSMVDSFVFSKTFAVIISDSLIPILYPDFSFRRIISGSWDWSAWPCHVRFLVCISISSPGWNAFVFMV